MEGECEPYTVLREERAEQRAWQADRPGVEAAQHFLGKAKGPVWLEQNEEEEER